MSYHGAENAEGNSGGAVDRREGTRCCQYLVQACSIVGVVVASDGIGIASTSQGVGVQTGRIETIVTYANKGFVADQTGPIIGGSTNVGGSSNDRSGRTRKALSTTASVLSLSKNTGTTSACSKGGSRSSSGQLGERSTSGETSSISLTIRK